MGISDIEILDITLPKTRAAIIVKNVIDEKIDHLIVGLCLFRQTSSSSIGSSQSSEWK